jgi:glycosyltransferase involved in cell wall biosynthesis
MSVRVFHPSVAPFVHQAALAFQEANLLDRLVTTLVHRPESGRQKALFRAARTAGYPLESRWRRRALPDIPSNRIQTHPLGEILRLSSGLFDRDGRLTDAVWEWAELRFDRLVARGLPSGQGITTLYGFEYSSLAAFLRARELGIRTVYELPAPEPRFVQNILDRELEGLPELRTKYHLYTAEREERRIARRRAEWAAAGTRVCASRFSRDSYAAAGLDVSQMHVIPYGTPEPVSLDVAARGGNRPDQPPVFLWAGTFGMRKGAHYLLAAWRKHSLGRHARLRVFGRVELPHNLLHPKPDGIEWMGSIPRDQLMIEYQKADLLLFPTLCDGFGLVATEAWSSGLPVLTTNRAGAADLLKDRVNGLLIPHGDEDAIAGALDWALVHRKELTLQREAARETALRWQWADYRRALRAAILPENPL